MFDRKTQDEGSMAQLENQTIQVYYEYHKSDEQRFASFLTHLQQAAPGERRPYSSKFGAIDLVSGVAIAVVFLLGASSRATIGKYLEGVFRSKDIVKLGESHREIIDEWMSKLGDEIGLLTQSVRQAEAIDLSADIFDGQSKAVSLEINLPGGVCYVVLNHADADDEIIAGIPEGVRAATAYAAEIGFPEDCPATQLYYDKTDKSWRYLLMPTFSGMGNHIDRYVDLKTGQVQLIPSGVHFDQLFDPHPEDQLKFLVSHHWHDRRK